MAGTRVAELVASLRLDAKNFSSALKESESKLTKFGSAAQKAGTKMTMALTLPIAGAAAGAIKAATDFETSMTKIQSMVGLSADTVQGFEKDVLRLAGQTAQAPRELADAMFFITSAGLRGATAVQALEASAKAAAVGMGEAEVVADAVTNAINGYGSANITAAEATDILAKTVEQGKASAEDLAPQFGRLIPMAAELGVSFDQVGGGLAFLTRASGNASQSTSALRGILRTLIKPSQMARQTLEDVGMSVEDLRSAADDDLLGALIDMRQTLEANGKEMGAVFEDSEALAGALQLTGTAAAEAAGVMDEMTRSAGTLERGMEAVQDTAGFKMSQAMNDLKIVMIDLGQKLIPIVVPLIQKLAAFIKDLADKFNNLSPFMQNVVIALAGIAAAAGPALIAIGSLAKGLGAMKKVGDGVTGMLTGGGGMAKGIGTLAAKLGMSTGGLGFAAAGAAAIIGGGLFLAIKAQKEEAERDRERVALLRQEMLDAGEASAILTTDVEKLTERLLALGDATGDGVVEVEAFSGRMVLLQELINRDVRDVFDQYIIDIDRHNEALENGSNAYDDLANNITTIKGLEEENAKAIEASTVFLGAEKAAILEAVRAGDLRGDQLIELLESLDKTADAHDDHNKELEEVAEKYFESAANVAAYEDALNAGQLSIVENLRAEGKHAEALEMVIGYTRSLEARQERLAKSAAQAAEAEAELAEDLAEVSIEVEDLGRVTESQIWNTNRALSRNILTWRRQRDAVVEAREAQQDFNEAFQDEMIMRTQQSFRGLQNWREGNLETLAELEEKKAKIQELADQERQAALHGQIQAQRRLEGIERDRLGLIEDIRDTRRDLNRLLDREEDIQSNSGRWALEYARNLSNARLSVMDITERIKELEATRDADPAAGVKNARQDVARLVMRAGIITSAEQALMEMGEIDAGQASLAEISAADAKALVNLRKRVVEVTKKMSDGEATQLDLLAAQEAYKESLDDITRESRDLQRARSRLSDAEADAIRLTKEQKRVQIQLVGAYADLAEATIERDGLLDKEANRTNALNEVAEKRIELDKQLLEQERVLLESGYDLATAQDELAAAQHRAWAAGSNVNGVLADQDALFKAVDTSVGKASNTVGNLRLEWDKLLKAMDDEEGGGGGGSGGSGGFVDSMLRQITSDLDPNAPVTGGFLTPLQWLAQSGAAATASPEDVARMLGMPSAAAEPIKEMATGGLITSGGLAKLHTGETVIPAGSGGNVSIVINVEGSVSSERDLVEAMRKGLLRAQQSGKALVL